MNRAAAPWALAFCLLGCLLLAGCAAPGDPVARHPIVPAAVADLSAQQYGNGFILKFTLPARSIDREALPEHPIIEIYRATLPPGSAPDRKTVWQLAYTIPSEQVDHYLSGEQIEFHDTVPPETFAQTTGSSNAYKVRTRAAKARASADSNIASVRIYPPPDAPRNIRVDVKESALVVQWEAVAAPRGAASLSYRVYRGTLESGQANPPQDVSQAKLKTPLELAGSSTSTEYGDMQFEFGMPYLYTVRSVAQFGNDFVESADSAPAIAMPRDVFPPAAPTNLESTIIPATDLTPAYIELSWAISPEADLAGYNVYRGDAEENPGERVNTEILPSPTFRDMSVQSGKRYYYRVSAVDRAGNESPKSSAVQADVP
jgi:hypothetical protein